jgi:flagellar motor switch protein FliN/FliY
MTPTSHRDSLSGGPPQARASGETDPRDNGRTLELLLDIELPLTVRFGATRMQLRDLLKLEPGSVIDLDRSPETGVELLVNGKLVARGTAVTVQGHYGVRISEIAAGREGVVPAAGLTEAARGLAATATAGGREN